MIGIGMTMSSVCLSVCNAASWLYDTCYCKCLHKWIGSAPWQLNFTTFNPLHRRYPWNSPPHEPLTLMPSGEYIKNTLNKQSAKISTTRIVIESMLFGCLRQCSTTSFLNTRWASQNSPIKQSMLAVKIPKTIPSSPGGGVASVSLPAATESFPRPTYIHTHFPLS